MVLRDCTSKRGCACGPHLSGWAKPCLGAVTQLAYIVPMSSIRPWRTIDRRPSRQIMVGNVPVGGDAPVTVQTMTNTPTSDPRATIDQIDRKSVV